MRLCTCHYNQLVRELPAVMKHNSLCGTTVPLTEAETETIHSQFGLGNQQFIHLARASQSLLFPTKHSCFCTWHHVETRENSRQKTESTEHTANETAVPSVEKNISPSLTWNESFTLLGTRRDHHSLLPAHRQPRKLLASGYFV